MSSRAQKTDNLGRESKLLRCKADFLRYVGALDGDGIWRWSDGEDCHNAELRKFRQSSVVQLDHVDVGCKTVEEYRLTPHARDYTEQHIETREEMCPCGHAGVENHGDHYECGFAPCDAAFQRAEVDA